MTGLSSRLGGKSHSFILSGKCNQALEYLFRGDGFNLQIVTNYSTEHQTFRFSVYDGNKRHLFGSVALDEITVQNLSNNSYSLTKLVYDEIKTSTIWNEIKKFHHKREMLGTNISKYIVDEAMDEKFIKWELKNNPSLVKPSADTSVMTDIIPDDMGNW